MDTIVVYIKSLTIKARRILESGFAFCSKEVFTTCKVVAPGLSLGQIKEMALDHQISSKYVTSASDNGLASVKSTKS